MRFATIKNKKLIENTWYYNAANRMFYYDPDNYLFYGTQIKIKIGDIILFFDTEKDHFLYKLYTLEDVVNSNTEITISIGDIIRLYL